MRYPKISEDLFIRNRKKLGGLFLPDSISVIFSNDEMYRNGDQFFPYRQSSDLFYLTGIQQEKTILLLCPSHTEKKLNQILFLEKATPEQETWFGHKLTIKEASEISGIETVYWREDFDRVLREITFKVQNIYLNNPEQLKFKTDVESGDQRMIRKIQSAFPLHNYHRLAPLMSKIRMIKEPEEIELIRQSCEITREAFIRVLKFMRPGVKEFEVEAEIIHEFIRRGAAGHAYAPIIASGINACVLHYIENDAYCKDGDLLLMDFGSEYANYAADLSRTIPVNGRFSKRQADVYDANLRVMKAAKKLMRPGTLMTEFHSEVCKVWEKEHIGLGLYSGDDVMKHSIQPALWFKYYMHGTSHSIGLDVHDCFEKTERFQPGMVFSCEPGIYLNEEGIGIRLENDILITEDGNIDLMENIPVEREEIEELMNSN